MSESELVGVIFQIRNQINFLWNFYVTACAILIGWLFSGTINWSRETWLVISMFFIIFAIINASAMHTEYQLLELALVDLSTLQNLNGEFLPQLAKTYGLGSLPSFLVHFVADIFLLWLLRHRFVKCRNTQ